jgi:hypothetical protein
LPRTILDKSRPILVQAVLVTILIIGYSVIIIDSDIVFFDSYVLKVISECYPTNQSEFCIDVRNSLGCDMTDQLCLGNKYWEQVNKQAVGLAVVLFFARIIPSLVNHFTNNRKFRPQTIFESFLWGVSALIFFLSGIIDYGYYALRKMSIPDQLYWLNHVGFFEYTKTFTGNALIVDKMDLILTLFLGLFIFMSVWLLAMYSYSRTGLKTLS